MKRPLAMIAALVMSVSLAACGSTQNAAKTGDTGAASNTNSMERLGFRTLLPSELQSPIITSFYYPDSPAFSFETFYKRIKQEGFVLYPGKITSAQTFRIGNIGDVHTVDMERLLAAIERNRFWS